MFFQREMEEIFWAEIEGIQERERIDRERLEAHSSGMVDMRGNKDSVGMNGK